MSSFYVVLRHSSEIQCIPNLTSASDIRNFLLSRDAEVVQKLSETFIAKLVILKTDLKIRNERLTFLFGDTEMDDDFAVHEGIFYFFSIFFFFFWMFLSRVSA